MEKYPAKTEAAQRVIKDPSFHLRIGAATPTIDDVVEQLSSYLETTKANKGDAYRSGTDTALSTLSDATEQSPGPPDAVSRLHNSRSILRWHQGTSVGERRRALDTAISALNQALYALSGIAKS